MNIPDPLDEIVQQLQSGLYVILDDLPNHGYYVTKQLSEKIITFTLCSISLKLGDFYGTLKFNKPQRLDITVPVCNVRNFLIYFLKYYTLSEQTSILVYDLGEKNFNWSEYNTTLYINPSAKVAMWKNEEIFKMENNKCIIEEFQPPWKSVYFNLKKDNRVILQLHGKEMILYPKSFESLFLMDKDLYQVLCLENCNRNRLLIERNVCEFKFLLEKNDRISVCMKTCNPYACWHFSNRYLFNILSDSIMKMLTVLKNSTHWGNTQILDDKISHDILNLKNVTFLYK